MGLMESDLAERGGQARRRPGWRQSAPAFVALRTLPDMEAPESAIAGPRAMCGPEARIPVGAAAVGAAGAGPGTDGAAVMEAVVEAAAPVAAVGRQARAPGAPGATCRARPDPRGAGLAVQGFGA